MSIFSTITVSSRSLRREARYQKERHTTRHVSCTFCHLSETHAKNGDQNQIIVNGEHMYVTRNIFPYALWDGSPVIDHLMIIPHRHVDALSSLHDTEHTEWLKYATEYEAKNYSIYARSSNNGAKSIVHQHTHLIKVGPRPKNFKAARYIGRILIGL